MGLVLGGAVWLQCPIAAFAQWAAWPATVSEGEPQPNPAELSRSDADFECRLAELEANLKRLEQQSQAHKQKAAEKLSVNFRGHFMLDAAAFSQNAEDRQRPDEQNGLDVRVARLIAEGKGLEVTSYKIEFDFVRRILGDLWIGVGQLPVVHNVRVGYLKEPFSMEQLASRKYNTFLERSLAEALHIPPRRLGIMAFDAPEDVDFTRAIGLFADAPGITLVQSDEFRGAVTMRATRLPWYDGATQGRGLLHTGLAFSHREPFRSSARFQARPESFLASYAIDTGNPAASAAHLVGTELALVHGPFSAQSEYVIAFVDLANRPNASLQGMYVMLSYFLTGEHRNYAKSQGVFGQIKPFEDFLRPSSAEGSRRGKGAWEVKYRYCISMRWMETK